MNHSNEFDFQSVHSGAGVTSETLELRSHYDQKTDEYQVKKDLFQDLLDSPKFYDQLVDRLEKPILDSLHPDVPAQVSGEGLLTRPFNPKANQKQRSTHLENIQTTQQDSPLNLFFLPSLTVFKVDMAFAVGMYSFGLALCLAVFRISPSWFFIVTGFGVFYQCYVVVCRALIGSTLGEERCNLVWENISIFRLVSRSLILTLTGFVLLPLCSLIVRRDLLEDCTGLQLQYAI